MPMPKTTPAPVELVSPLVPGAIYSNSKLEVSLDYLRVFASLETLRLKGIESVHHKQKVGYYTQLLGNAKQVSTKALQQDTMVSGECAYVDLEVLAIADGQVEDDDECTYADVLDDEPMEGDPTEFDADPTGHLHAHVGVDSDHKFGPFGFRIVHSFTQTKDGDVRTQTKWVVRCPFHKDVGDAAGTACTKALVFHGAEHREVCRLQLREWCLAGRHKQYRALWSAESHKGIDPMTLVPAFLAEQQSRLDAALLEPDWIIDELDDAVAASVGL